MCRVGLRIDVDTLRGTRTGVPSLIDLLACHDIRASFFFSVGPDNMGRHLWRLLRPAFLVKMLRTRAASLYGWDILLRGTFWPGPVIGEKCPVPIRSAAIAGHEVGLHAWDHHRWQSAVGKMDAASVEAEIRKGFDLMTRILGSAPDCFAAPAWRATPEVLKALERFPFRFSSDCRGRSIFRPLVDGRRLGHVQIPVTLPTYDELIGTTCSPETYNDHILEMIRPNVLNVLTIHAEAEGIACRDLFQDFLVKAKQRGIVFEPLGDLLSRTGELPEASIVQTVIPGRDGWVSVQAQGPERMGQSAEGIG